MSGEVNRYDVADRRELRRAALERRRRELEGALRELRAASAEALNPSHRVARHPYTWMLGALVLGVVWGRHAALRRAAPDG